MARIPKVPKTPKAPKAPKGPTQAPQAPAGKEKFLDRMGRYSMYGQMFGNDSANMSMGQRIGGAAYSAFEQATLGQMGTLGRAMSAGISARGRKDQAGGSGPHDTQDIQFQQIKGDDVVAAINQSTGQMVAGLNTVNHTLGRGFNRLGDDIQAQGQALNSIVAANDKLAIEMRELYEQLNKMAYDRGGGGGANASTLGGRGGPVGGQGGAGGGGLLGSILGTLLTGAGLAGGANVLKKMLGISDDVKPNATPEAKSPATKEPPARQPKGAVDAEGRKVGGQFTPRPSAPATPGGSWYDDAMKLFKGAGKGIANLGAKAATPVLAAIAIWDAWQQISALDPNMPLEKYRAEVAKIVGKAVGEFGLVLVGGIIGAIIAGAVSGPGAIIGLIGGLAGGLAAQYALGDNVDAIVDSIVNYLYQGKDEPAKKTSSNDAAKQLTKARMKEEGEGLLKDASVVEDFAVKMGLSPDNVQAKTEGGVPVEINGVPVPDELYTDEQRKNIKAARDMKKMMQGKQVASLPGATMTDVPADASPTGATPIPENWDEEFYKKFPEWMNVKDLDYPPSRLMDSPTGLEGPDTSEQKLKQQERVSEEEQKKTIGENLLINAKELTFKADKIVFDTSSLEFNYDAKTTLAGASAPSSPSAPSPQSPGSTPSSVSATARAGVSPSARLPGGATPGSIAQAASAPSSVTPGSIPGAVVNGSAVPIPAENGRDQPLPQAYAKPPGTTGTGAGDLGERAESASGVLGVAKQMLGLNENRDHDALQGFMNQYSGTPPLPINTDRGPWCAKFVNGVLGSQGLPGTGANLARSFLNYGATVYDKATGQGDPTQAQPGDIVVVPRGGGNKGHVAFVESVSGETINTIGGNQSDGGGGGVTRSRVKISEVLGIRRPGGAGTAVAANVPTGPGSTGPGVSPGAAPSAAPSASPGGAPGASPVASSPTVGGGGIPTNVGAGNPLAAMLGGGGSPFGMASSMLGPLIGSMSKNASLNAAAPPAGPATTNVFNSTTPSSSGNNAETINPGAPQPAISSMFAKLFDGSAMFG